MKESICRTPYLSPDPVFRRLKLEQFVGRQWLISQIDHFLHQHDRGYVLIEGEAGVGKTSFLASLVHRRGYIHVFIEQARGLDNAARALRSLAAQIIRNWSLQHWFADDVLPGVAARPDFLRRLLATAARRRDLIHPDQPIVLVIDGLDEAGVPPGQNALGLPRTLPHGVYIIASHRLGSLELVIEGPVQTFTILADDPRHRADMQHYLEQVLASPPLSEDIQTSGYTHHYAVAALLATSQGNWTYLAHIIEELERSRANPTSPPIQLEALPNTIWAYYAHWVRRQRETLGAWDTCWLPLLGTLCAVWEPVSMALLCKLAGLPDIPASLPTVLHHAWAPFLLILPKPESRYALGDTMFRDFLCGRVDGQPISQEDRALSIALAETVRAAHDRISSYYVDSWGTLARGLPVLFAWNYPAPDRHDNREGEQDREVPMGEEQDDECYTYGLRHLVAHLDGANRHDDIHCLLQLEHTLPEPPAVSPPAPSAAPGWLSWWRRLSSSVSARPSPLPVEPKRIWLWHMVRERQGELDDFLSDVAQAWRLCEGRGQGRDNGVITCQRTTVPYSAIGLQCRYAFINTSIRSLAADIPIPLLIALLENEIWLPAQLLVYLRQIPREEQLVTTLARFAPHLPNTIMEDVLALVQTVADEQTLARALAAIVDALPPTMLAEALGIARAIEHPAWRVVALVGIAHAFPECEREPLLREVLDTIETLWNTELRVEVLIQMAPVLPEPLWPQAIASANAILDTNWRAEALVGLAHSLPPKLLRETLAFWEAWDDYWKARVLNELSERLGELTDIPRALTIARGIGKEHYRVMAVVGLAPHLDTTQLSLVLDDIQHFHDPTEQATALIGVIPFLPPSLRMQALTIARAIQPVVERIRALTAMLPYVEPDGQSRLIEELRAGISKIDQEGPRYEAIEKLAETLARLGHREMAVDIANMVKAKGEHTRILARIAAYHPDLSRAELLERAATLENPEQRHAIIQELAPLLSVPLLWKALDIARAIGDGSERARTLGRMFPYLPFARLSAVFKTVLTIGDERGRAQAMVELAAHLSESMLREALEHTLLMEREDCQRTIVVGLASYLSEPMLKTALEVVPRMQSEEERATTLVGLAPYLPPPLLREALEMALAMETESERTRALAGLTPRLSESQLQRVLAASRNLKHPQHRSVLLRVLAPTLASRGYWRQGLEAAWGIQKPEDRALAMVQLAPYLPQIMLKDVMATVRRLHQPDQKAKALAMIHRYLPAEEHPYVLHEILSIAQSARWRGEATPSQIVPLLDDPQVGSIVFRAIQMLESPDERAAALTDIAPFLDEPLRSEALWSALAAARMIWGPYRANALVRLAPLLSEPMLREVLADIQVLEQQEWRAMALRGIIPFLPADVAHTVIQEPLAAARTIWGKAERVRTLAALIPYAAPADRGALLAETLEVACSIDDMDARREALASIIPLLEGLPNDELYALWVKMLYALATPTIRLRRDLLSDLRVIYPIILRIGGETALDHTAQAILDVGRWLP